MVALDNLLSHNKLESKIKRGLWFIVIDSLIFNKLNIMIYIFNPLKTQFFVKTLKNVFNRWIQVNNQKKKLSVLGRYSNANFQESVLKS